jgi:hypothetical protein
MLTNYILVDYENVQNIDLSSIQDKNIYIKMFVGSKQNNIPTDLVVKSQKLGNQIDSDLAVEISCAIQNNISLTNAQTENQSSC